MIPEAALAAAAPGTILVARPHRRVAHLYRGPLTPSGYVPRTHRTVCRAHTRRLAPLPTERRSSLDPASSGHRVCARCAVRLPSHIGRRTARTPRTRQEWARRYAGLELRDLWAQTLTAETLDELEAVAHASLLVAGHATCQQPAPAPVRWAPHGITLTQLIGNTRERLADYPNRARSEALTALVETGYAAAKAQRIADRQDREARIRRVGFINATADEAPRRARRRTP